ncbi:MAG: tetratricopeptide repeat protein [Planctomycetes bacterium]|nr:tetratricopeptide repeat protein [Planctomycetota bacterium]
MGDQMFSEVDGYRIACFARPDDLDLHVRLLISCVHGGQSGRLPEEFARIVTRRPSHPQFHYEIIDRVLKATGIREPKRAFKQAAGRSEQRHLAFYGLGLLLQAADKQSAALAAFKKAIKAKSDFACAHYSISVSHMTFGDLKEARESSRVASNCDHYMAEPWYVKGTCYLERRNPHGAAPCFDQFLRLSGPYLARYAADACEKLKWLEETLEEELYRRGRIPKRVDPSEEDLRVGRKMLASAFTAFDSGRYDDARSAASDAARQFESLRHRLGHVDALQLLARVDHETGKIREALTRYDETLKVSRKLGYDTGIARAFQGKARIDGAEGELVSAETGFRYVIGFCAARRDEVSLLTVTDQICHLAARALSRPELFVPAVQRDECPLGSPRDFVETRGHIIMSEFKDSGREHSETLVKQAMAARSNDRQFFSYLVYELERLQVPVSLRSKT